MAAARRRRSRAAPDNRLVKRARHRRVAVRRGYSDIVTIRFYNNTAAAAALGVT